jgi:hypothetical protein
MFTWLAEKLCSLCHTKSGQPTATLVFPSQRTTDRIISILEDVRNIEKFRHFSGFTFGPLPDRHVIPLVCFGESAASPLRFSPLAFERLSTSIETLRSQTGKARVVIFDDAIISGKTMREIEQVVRGIGAAEVHTVALADRSGLPATLGYAIKHTERHHRFWRWDVPALGQIRGCPLCAAILQANSFRVRETSPEFLRRLQDWQELWKPRDAIDEWDATITPPRKTSDHQEELTHRFCVYPNGAVTASHRVTHSTTVGFTAAALEIARATGNYSFALNKCKSIVAAFGEPDVGIEILSAQLLLFLDDLGIWQKADYFYELLALLWAAEADSPFTALAGLCMLLLPDELLRSVLNRFENGPFKLRKVATTDARMTMQVLRYREKLVSPARAPSKLDGNEIARYNYSLTSTDRTFVQSLGNVFAHIGASRRGGHAVGIPMSLRQIVEACSRHDITAAAVAQRSVVFELQRMSDDFAHLGASAQNYLAIEVEDIDSDLALIRDFLSQSPETSSLSTEEAVERLSAWADAIEEKMFIGSNALAERYRARFTFDPPVAKPTGNFLDEYVSSLNLSWREWVAQKRNQNEHIPERWSTSGPPPYIEVTPAGNWSQRTEPIFVDRFIKQCIHEVFQNFVHIPFDITNPWLQRGASAGANTLQATMWCRVLQREHDVVIEFANGCDTAAISYHISQARVHLDFLGGELKARVFERRGDIVPCDGKGDPDDKDSLVGVAEGRRVAVVALRLPLVRELR